MEVKMAKKIIREVSLSADFGEIKGKIKPMHAVNNGPVYKFAADQLL